ncbi:MAG TPA: hypothetical protein VM345_03020 [Acidimicrobiales bacterium]|jgi:DNA-directed RNA polymerase sigma subunit (sigma70/sigma32)|nr:hypothetical protein [Acidimicrobiales bacterium]
MRTFLWPAEDGWPYPDGEGDLVDVAGETDDDLLSITTDRHLFDDLDPLERRVISASFGLGGVDERSIAELHDELGIDDLDLVHARDTGLEKLRAHLRA